MQEALDYYEKEFATFGSIYLDLEIDGLPVLCRIDKENECFTTYMGHPGTIVKFVDQVYNFMQVFPRIDKLIDQAKYCPLTDDFLHPSVIKENNIRYKHMVSLLPNLYKGKDTTCRVCHEPCNKLEFMRCEHFVCRLCWFDMDMKEKVCPQCCVRVQPKRPRESNDVDK